MSLSGLLWPEPLIDDSADQQSSTMGSETGILMGVHPGLLEVGLGRTSNCPGRFRMNNLPRDHSENTAMELTSTQAYWLSHF